MKLLVLIVAANMLAAAFSWVIERRSTRPTTASHLCEWARRCERQGWIPLRFRWRGVLRTTATLEMRHHDGRSFTVRVWPT